MKGKVLLIVGLGVGYVLGARAGRERYDQIAGVASKFWNNPKVQKQVGRSKDFVNDKVDAALDLAAVGAKKAVGRVTGAKPAAKKPAAKTGAAKTSAAKPAVKAAAAKSADSDA